MHVTAKPIEHRTAWAEKKLFKEKKIENWRNPKRKGKNKEKEKKTKKKKARHTEYIIYVRRGSRFEAQSQKNAQQSARVSECVWW